MRPINIDSNVFINSFLVFYFLKVNANKVHARGDPLNNSFGDFDRTVCQISWSKLNKKNICNEYKRVHEFTFQNVALLNGLIASLKENLLKGRDTVRFQSSILRDMQIDAFFNGVPLLIVIQLDPPCPHNLHVQTPFQTLNLTKEQKKCNLKVKTVRVSFELRFGDIKNYFKFID